MMLFPALPDVAWMAMRGSLDLIRNLLNFIELVLNNFELHGFLLFYPIGNDLIMYSESLFLYLVLMLAFFIYNHIFLCLVRMCVYFFLRNIYVIWN